MEGDNWAFIWGKNHLSWAIGSKELNVPPLQTFCLDIFAGVLYSRSIKGCVFTISFYIIYMRLYLDARPRLVIDSSHFTSAVVCPERPSTSIFTLMNFASLKDSLSAARPRLSICYDHECIFGSAWNAAQLQPLNTPQNP